jgi:transcriptional regulator with XRE-family HTH domain
MAIAQTVEEMEWELGDKLKRLRLNKNLDQRSLAARAGVSVRALRNLESGEGSTLKTLLSVIRALGRESWLQTVAPVPTINPATFTTRAATRLRASSPATKPRAAQPNQSARSLTASGPTKPRKRNDERDQ